MTRKNLIAVIFLLGLQHAVAWGGDVVVVQSARLKAYDTALEGFECVLSQDIPARGPKSIQAHTLTSYILSETKSPGQLRKDIVRQHPDLLLVIGSSSLSLVKNITDIPIIYLMVPYPELMIKAQDNITGININVSAEQQLKALLRAIPQTKNVGLLYDQKQTGMIVQEAKEFAALHNDISLVALPVKKSSEVPGQLVKLADKVDCFWMLPDRTVLTPQTVDYIFLFSLENKIPILTFSTKYLDMGAVLSVSFDSYDMGKQAGELAMQILSKEKTGDIPPEKVRKVRVNKNYSAAEMLGIVLEGQGPQE